MKKILILTLLILTACSSATSPTPASFLDPQTAEAILTETAVPTDMPVVTESFSTSEAETGELYFFLQPRQAGQSIQLVRVSSVCVFDAGKCPPVETIQVPFAFNFNINALSWSPDGN